MKNIRFFSLCLLLTLVACSSEGSGYNKSQSIQNELAKNIPQPWGELSSDGSDYALENEKTKSIFLFNSACRKYEGGTLNSLTASMLSGIDKLEISAKKNVQFQGRDASEVLASGSVDGVMRFFKIITLQKNNCIYDFVLISTNKKNIDLDSNALDGFVKKIVLN